MEKINELSSEDRKNFENILTAVLQDDMWLSLRGLHNENTGMAKIVLYGEMIEGDFSYLRGTHLN